MNKPPLKIILANPRGFCAGVDRAIHIVEKALEKYGPPVYVRHEIVHNRFVVESLEKKGAIFVEDLDQVPSDKPVIFSAHGVPKSVPEEARRRHMLYLDATCPLVSKVHHEAQHHHAAGRLIALIGHRGHPEVIGTMGQLPEGAVMLIESVEDAEALNVPVNISLAYVTQTTLSVDETRDIVSILKQRFPNLVEPKKEDICYATTNRQLAVKVIAPQVERLIVIGAANSSNSVRLMEVARAHGCREARLCATAADVDWSWLQSASSLGITAGASAPEILVEELINACSKHFDITLDNVTVATEDVHFNLPRLLTA